MTNWEAIGLKPRKIKQWTASDGEVIELVFWPFRFPPRTIGKPCRMPKDIEKPW